MKTIEELGISKLPWSADDWIETEHGEYDVRIRDANDNEIAQPLSTFDDAILIAAAPELYEALAALLHCTEREAPYTDMSRMTTAMDLARKALAKAGREEVEHV